MFHYAPCHVANGFGGALRGYSRISFQANMLRSDD